MYEANPDVIETDLHGELILLDPTSGEMFSLNEAGRIVWRTLPFGSPADAAAVIESAMDVDAPTAERDVRLLLERLLAVGLVRGAPATSDEG